MHTPLKNFIIFLCITPINLSGIKDNEIQIIKEYYQTFPRISAKILINTKVLLTGVKQNRQNQFKIDIFYIPVPAFLEVS